MPNIDDFFWITVVYVAVLLLSIFLTYFFVRTQAKTKLIALEEKERATQNQWKIFETETENKLNELKQQLEQTRKDKNSLALDLSAKETHLDNSEQRIFEYKEIEKSLNQKIENQQDLFQKQSVELNVAQTDIKNLKEKLNEEKKHIEEINQKFQKEFENLANKILDEKSEKFTNQNKENILTLLNPLQEKIKGFEKRVEDTHKESLKDGAMLRQQILGLKELNQQMSKEANNLTRALKGDSKAQGNWGEMILRTVLEKSGLQKDVEYFEQQTFTDSNGRRVQPDVIIHMPYDKRMIVDAKVSLTAYEAYVNEVDEDEKKKLASQHLLSIKRHIEQLGQKNYHQIYEMESPDFVLLFIPIEAAFAVASQSDNNLYQSAFERNIILVTPTTLLAVLKTIDSMWNNEKQKTNYLEITKQAVSLYDTFVNLTEELLKVERQMGTVQKSFDSAMIKLTGRGNIIRRIEKLRKLGVKANKQIDQELLRKSELDYDDE